MRVGWIIAGVMGVLGLVLFAASGTPAWAQVTSLSVSTAPERVGITGYVRAGQWAPLALDLRNDAASARRLICEWTVPDADGDQAQYRRIATVSPQSTQRVWLYAPPPTGGRIPPQWSLRVIEVAPSAGIDSESGRLLHRSTINPREWADPDQRLIGVLGSAGLGLHPYEEKWTTQERTRVLRGMTLADLPDRWYGLAVLSALIWTPEGGDPSAAELPQACRQALREWVRRGGHLVVILPAVGDAWFNSPLKDMLPINREQVRRVENSSVLERPLWLGDPVRDGGIRFDWRWFDLESSAESPAATGPGSPNANSTVLLRDLQNHPVVVAGAYGLGRVTVIGIDLTDSRLVRLGLPNSITQNVNPLNHDPRGVTLWPVVFGWRGPVYREAYLADELKHNRISRIQIRQIMDPSDFLAQAVAMRGAAAPRVALAVLVFILYWLLAGPVGFLVLRAKGMVRQSWLAFTAVVLVFAAIAWSGALILRPQRLSIEHWSVLDGDVNTGQVRVQSFSTVLVPRHGKAVLTMTPSSAGDLMLSPGMSSSSDQAGFIDPQTYVYDAADPRRTRMPMRSTARSMFLVHQYDPLQPSRLGQDPGEVEGNNPAQQPGQVWCELPEGTLRTEKNGPHGNLTHRLPLPLRNVLAIYCPGQGREPYVWRLGDWTSDQSLPIRGIPDNAPRLLTPPALVQQQSDNPLDRAWSGHMGQLIRRRNNWQMNMSQVSDAEMYAQAQILSFFDTLPPPDFRDVGIPGPVQYQRLLGRSLDLTPLLAMPRLILLGVLEDRDRSVLPAPVPLAVDGQTPTATGITLVRWIFPVP